MRRSALCCAIKTEKPHNVSTVASPLLRAYILKLITHTLRRESRLSVARQLEPILKFASTSRKLFCSR